MLEIEAVVLWSLIVHYVLSIKNKSTIVWCIFVGYTYDVLVRQDYGFTFPIGNLRYTEFAFFLLIFRTKQNHFNTCFVCLCWKSFLIVKILSFNAQDWLSLDDHWCRNLETKFWLQTIYSLLLIRNIDNWYYFRFKTYHSNLDDYDEINVLNTLSISTLIFRRKYNQQIENDNK
jgi:hypothetical protein